jgi:hypothetical protein
MTEQEFIEAVDALSAYDSGATDSGIHDLELFSRVWKQFNDWDETTRNIAMSHLFMKYLSEEALAEGYGYEDVIDLIDWFRDNDFFL